jgi:hypothetical protein
LSPEIGQITTESALSQGSELKVQTVITWQTSEPAICQVLYGEGIVADETAMPKSTNPENSYSRKHTAIITDFKPGQVYSFRIRAIDSGDNLALSKLHTLLTPQQKASVFDLIINNLESTFGWLAKLSR